MCLPSACRQESKSCLPRTEGKDLETSLLSPTGACVTPSMAAVDEHQESKGDLSLCSAALSSQASKRIRNQHEEEAQANTGIIKQVEELAGF